MYVKLYQLINSFSFYIILGALLAYYLFIESCSYLWFQQLPFSTAVRSIKHICNSLLLKDLLLVFGPNIHELPGFVHLHRVVHQAVHVDELHSPLLGVVHHGGDDWQLSHLFLVVLWNMVATVTPTENSLPSSINHLSAYGNLLAAFATYVD